MSTLAAAREAAVSHTTPAASLGLGGAGVLFFLSGASALVYQVAWQRILALHTGVGIYWLARLDSPAVSGYLGPRIAEQVRQRLVKFQPLVRSSRRVIALNHDLFPRDEFLSP